MKMLIINIGLALIWALMTESFTFASILFGVVASYLVLWFLSPLVGGEAYFRKVPQCLRFALFILKELVVANLRIAWHIVTPSSFFKPGVLAVPLEPMSEVEVAVLANIVTLTPGSFTVDVSRDRSVLYVHMMDIDDIEAARQSIKDQYEKPLLEVLR